MIAFFRYRVPPEASALLVYLNVILYPTVVVGIHHQT